MYRLIPYFLILFVLLAGCTENNEKSDIYNGRDLHIGVIGDKPVVREKNIDFKNISLKELENQTDNISDTFDAIFIMPGFLADAANDKYAKVYGNLTIPSFFIQSKKAHIPFVNEDVTYKNAPEVGGSSNYATGYLYTGSTKEYADETWRFTLMKNINKGENVKGVYSRIFKTIDKISH